MNLLPPCDNLQIRKHNRQAAQQTCGKRRPSHVTGQNVKDWWVKKEKWRKKCTPALEEGHIENRCKGVHGFEKERLEDEPLFKFFRCFRKFWGKGEKPHQVQSTPPPSHGTRLTVSILLVYLVLSDLFIFCLQLHICFTLSTYLKAVPSSVSHTAIAP